MGMLLGGGGYEKGCADSICAFGCGGMSASESCAHSSFTGEQAKERRRREPTSRTRFGDVGVHRACGIGIRIKGQDALARDHPAVAVSDITRYENLDGFREGDLDNKEFYVPVLSFLALTAVVLLAVHADDIGLTLGEYACRGDDCSIQRWLETIATIVALGAAITAGLTGFGQLAEMRRQTSSIVGADGPEFEIKLAATADTHAEYTIVNTNRKSVVMRRVTLSMQDGRNAPIPTHIASGVHKMVLRENGRPYYSLGVKGWRNRQEAPPEVDFTLIFDGPTQEFVAANPMSKIRIEVDFEFPASGLPKVQRSLTLRSAEAFASNIRPEHVRS
jgi:hypothetical protein